MKVLFYSHQSAFLYGGEIVTLEFMRALKERGVDVHFAAPAGPYLDRARETGAKCFEVSSIQFSRKISQLPSILSAFSRTANELRGIIAREKIEILHATSLKAMAYVWALGNSIPVFWHHHDILPDGVANSLWLRGLALRAAKILTPSRATGHALEKAGISKEKIFVLFNGFRLSEWTSRPPQRPDHLFRVGLVGEISPRKGTDRLEEVLLELGDISGMQFLIVGEGLSNPEFAAKLREKLQSKQVRFLGRLNKMKLMYHEFDVLLVPSRQDPLPTVIVEAGLSAVPVVAANVGGIPEMIEQGRNGFLFNSEKEAAEAIRQVQKDWARLSKGSREVAESRYDVDKLAKNLVGQYEAALNA